MEQSIDFNWTLQTLDGFFELRRQEVGYAILGCFQVADVAMAGARDAGFI